MTTPTFPVHTLQVRTLDGRDTIAQGQCCDLKLEDSNGDRWWLCRMPAGETDHRITVETYDPALPGWTTDRVYTDRLED